MAEMMSGRVRDGRSDVGRRQSPPPWGNWTYGHCLVWPIWRRSLTCDGPLGQEPSPFFGLNRQRAAGESKVLRRGE